MAKLVQIKSSPNNPLISDVFIGGHKIDGVYAYTIKESAEPENGVTKYPSIRLDVEITGDVQVDIKGWG